METILVDVVTSEYSLSLVDMIFVPVDLQLGCLSERKKFLEMTLMLIAADEIQLPKKVVQSPL